MPRIRQIDPNVKYFPPRLMEKLEFIKNYPISVIEAPSGFGKTTILEHFLEDRLPKAVKRYVYDFESDEPLYIWEQICDRFAKIDPVCGERLLRIGPPDEDTLPDLGQALRELDCWEETYLWLDNYKRWDNDCSGNFLDLLGQHGGEHLHIILSTQPLSLEKQGTLSWRTRFWRLQDDDLTFKEEDVMAYFLEAGIPLSHEQCQQVYHLTEGWVMALCLQMMCYINRGEFETNGMMALMEHTFWDYLTEDERSFLLKLSIFPRFTLAQANVLSGLGMEQTDRMLRDKRYFIHYDPEKKAFYPHSQLRKLLENHFELLDPETKRAIYLQGGELAEQARDRLNTLRFYHAANERERILSMPLSSYEVADVMAADVGKIVVDLMENTPMELKLRYPRAEIGLAFVFFIMGETEKLLERQPEIHEIIENCDLPENEKDALRGELELLLSFLEYNRISDMSARHRRALKLLGGPAKLISPKSIWTFGSPSILYLYWRESGKLDEELEEMDTCMPIYYQLVHGHGYGAELVMRAEAHLMRGELEEATPLCYQALYAAQSHHQDSIYLCGLFLMCRIALQCGNWEELDSALQSLRELTAKHWEDLSRYTLDLGEGYLSLLQGKPECVAPWLANGDITDKRLVLMVKPLGYIIYGRCLLVARDYHKLLGVSSYFIGLSKIFPNLLPQVYAHIYCAQALSAMGRKEEAAERLQAALDLAIPDRLYLPFAENYDGLRYMLPMAKLHRADLKAIMDLAPAYQKSGTAEAEPAAFTPRERSIHYLLREDLTNKEIAARLNLSPNTVRNIISGMMQKRGVSTRVQLRELPEE